MLNKYFFIYALFIVSYSSIYAQKPDTIKIYFDINSSKISNTYFDELKSISKRDIKNIEILSYTDFLGSKDHNLNLSQQRANKVKQFLISLGIDQKKIILCEGKAIHKNSNANNRTDTTDRGIPKHRLSEIIFVYNEIENTNKYIYTDTFNLKKNKYIEKDHTDLMSVKAEDLKQGQKFIIKNINFKGGTPTFLPQSQEPLFELLRIMKENPNLNIEIIGHICCELSNGADGYDYVNQNDKLSYNRAKAVFDFLVENGINETRMTCNGMRSSQKLYPEEKSDWERQQNRRVEIKVLKN